MNTVKFLKIENTFNITGRGTVWVINMKKNGISEDKKDWKKDGIYLGAQVNSKDNHVHTIIGIETQGGLDSPQNVAGLLVKPVNKEEPKSIVDVMKPLQLKGNLMMDAALNKSKYFIPTIEDIRVGFECEWFRQSTGWEKMTVGWDQIEQLSTDRMRVPYLTREYIESKGWTFVESRKDTSVFDSPVLHTFTKRFCDDWMDGYTYNWTMYVEDLSIFGLHPLGKIVIEEEKSGGFMGTRSKHVVYWGDCKCPNTFNYLSNLLKIK